MSRVNSLVLWWEYNTLDTRGTGSPANGGELGELGVSWVSTRRFWNEDSLYARASAIVNRDDGAPALGARRHERLVQQEMQNRRRNYAGEDHDWTFRRGAHRCEQCRCRLPEFIFECRGCRIMVRRRCRYNQL